VTGDGGSLLTPRELSDALKVPIATVYYWVSRNEVPFLKVGRHLRFNLSEVIESFEEKALEAKRTCGLSALELDPARSESSLKSKNAGHVDLPRKER
jgi:excisionase family DNA binding protein